jgi:hypothetical protein
MTDLRGRLALASLVFALCTAGCASMQVAKGSPTRVLEDKKPEEIEIRRVDGSRVHLYRPVVRADTIWGGTSRDDQVRRASVALSDVSAVSMRQFSGGRTILLVVLGAAAVFTVAVVTTFARGGIC